MGRGLRFLRCLLRRRGRRVEVHVAWTGWKLQDGLRGKMGRLPLLDHLWR